MTKLPNQLLREGWQVTHHIVLPPRTAEFFDFNDLSLTAPTRSFLRSSAPGGLYKHQKESLRRTLEGENLCQLTGTASGKSLPFMAAAVEQIARDPEARVVAIYPLRALAREQQDRWEQALISAGLDAQTGRVDGQVRFPERLSIVQNAKVLILTPDIIHAWMLPNLAEDQLHSFLSKVSLVIVDEVHTYTGVFGSNSAYLFRRLRHLMSRLSARPRWICSSATMENPKTHLQQLFGLNFSLVGAEHDTSQRHEISIEMLSPPGEGSLLRETTSLLRSLVSDESTRFLTFVDSRKQTEYLASMLSEANLPDGDGGEGGLSHLISNSILPYRSGYEDHDRSVIQSRLSSGRLRGVVSTSALELGLDIPGLDTVVLVGVPHSATSLWQRIGRVGRHGPGTVLVLNSGDPYDNTIFADPQTLLQRPLAESTLYLDNQRIQMIHALCLARSGGEDETTRSLLGLPQGNALSSDIEWPAGFLDLCSAYKMDDLPGHLQAIVRDGARSPNHAFPLRDVESQFRVELKAGPRVHSLGSLTYDQLLREAYAGAIYYYTSKPFRVWAINTKSRRVQVRPEKRFTTEPNPLPSRIFPYLDRKRILAAFRHGDLFVAECELQIRNAISGFTERRGPNKIVCSYPVNYEQTGVRYGASRLARNYFTTGVLLFHSALNSADGPILELAVQALYNAFLMEIPVERQDIDAGHDRLLYKSDLMPAGSHFIALYDRTYGSLRLTSRLLKSDGLRRVFTSAERISRLTETQGEASDLVAKLAHCLDIQAVNVDLGANPEERENDPNIVVMPGSPGLCALHNNEEFIVEEIAPHPSLEGLCYKGTHANSLENRPDRAAVREVIPLSALIQIPGESVMGRLDPETLAIAPI